MFKLGIERVVNARACPGFYLIQIVYMISGEFGVTYPSGKIEWVPKQLP